MASLIKENFFQEKWQAVRADIQNVWAHLTGEELEASQGDVELIAGLIQKKYGMGQTEVRQKLEEVLARHRAELKEKHQAGEDLIEREDRDSAPANLRDQYRQL